MQRSPANFPGRDDAERQMASNSGAPLVYAIKIRRFIALFLLTLPLALIHRMDSDWLVPLITMMVAYPLMSLDQIGIELQNPFAKANLSHLPIGDISNTIERNLLGLLKVVNSDAQGRPTSPKLCGANNEPL
jgi:predicted membrane chloride channel (bestrophin family)